ncbi:MAG: hypothetical protein KC561_01020, partial [Myxococcales bacterium]|nr:hypothetical protein [Myxococcales bacterium]
PFVYGPYLAAHDGSRSNRWGVSTFSDSADRILFGTKLDAIADFISGTPVSELDTSEDCGLFLGLTYDWLTQGDIYVSGDETSQVSASFEYRRPELGPTLRDFVASLTITHAFAEDFQTSIWAFPLRLEGVAGPLAFSAQYTLLIGKTREISEGFAVLSNTDPVVQDLLAMGAQLILDYTVGPVTFTLEADYATGDEDPRPTTDITVFNFSRDLNVGLLLFEHILAFESARSAAVGVENLASLDSESFPITEVSTEGRFTNAIAIFPQVLVNMVNSGRHRIHGRFGALFAWPEAGVVDPIMTILGEDGNRIDDDAVNFHGGDPGTYLGTELDLQFEWSIANVFFWTLEGAVLFPGNSLEDEHGDAVNAFLLENRFVVAF